MNPPRQQILWQRTRRLTFGLLALWLLVSLAGPWFARDLQMLHVWGYPLSFWLASQGALLLFIAIIIVYALWMDQLEARAADRPATAQPEAESDTA